MSTQTSGVTQEVQKQTQIQMELQYIYDKEGI